MKEDLDSLTKERHALKEDLDETKARLINIERIKNEQEAQNAHLAEQFAEMNLREENREAEHEDLINNITEKVMRLQQEKADQTDSLKKRDAELREAHATIKDYEKRVQANEQEKIRQQLEAQIRTLHEEKTEALDQSIQHQQRNQHLLAQLDRFKEDEKKSQHAMAEATRRTKQLELDLAKAKRLTPNSAVIGGGLALLCLGAMSARVFRPGK